MSRFGYDRAHMRTPPSRPAPRGKPAALILALAGGLAAGCVSINLETTPSTPARWETGTIEVRVYDRPADKRAGNLTHRAILSELFVVDEKGRERPLHWTPDARWTISAVEEGSYVLRVRSWLDAAGQRQPLGSSGKLAFSVGEGETVRISVVVASTAKAAENAFAAVATVGLVVLCVEHPAECLDQ